MGGLKVLITNNTLDERAGSELYVRDIALGLRARGHAPVAFSRALGAVARELRDAQIPVVDDLGAIGAPPDLIHGQHHLETTIAALRFPGVPLISFCHGVVPWEELPARLPSVSRYVAVDLACRDRLVRECGIPAEQVSLLFNFVDLARFGVRGPLPARPRRALIFSNTACEATHVPPIRAACASRGIELDVAGSASQVLAAPEAVLGGYDLVFAKARAAMEAMATGCAVVLCDRAGAGPLVTSGEFEALREWNFGIRTLRHRVDAHWIGGQIDRFDAADAGRVRELMRERGGLEQRLDELLGLYASVLAAPRLPHEPDALAVAASGYLQWLLPAIKGRGLPPAEAALQRIDALEERLRSREREVTRLNREPGLRLQAAVCRLPVAGPLVRVLGRLLFGTSGPPPAAGTGRP